MKQIYFVLTERCNLSCSHCIRDSSPWRDEAAELELMLKALAEVGMLYGTEATVLLTGGEPTLYKGFNEMLGRARDLGLDVIVNSNGVTSYFKPANIAQLAHRSVLVQISLDGSKGQHESIRGRGTYDRALRTLRALVEHGVKCSVSTTVMNASFFATANEFLDDLDGIGLRHISIKRATYAGRASAGSSLTSAQWNSGVYSLRKSPRSTPLRTSPMYDFDRLRLLSETQLAEIDVGPYGTNCGAGTAKVYVYPSGDVCSCTCFREAPIGNLYQAGLATIVGSYKPPEVQPGVCSSCRYVSVCRGGCLGSGYQYYGVLGAPDPRCGIVAAGMPAGGQGAQRA